MAVFLSKSAQQDENSISFTYNFGILRPVESKQAHSRIHSQVPTSALSSKSLEKKNDVKYDCYDPVWREHCEEVLRRVERFNDHLRNRYGIKPKEEDAHDDDMRPRFLRTSDTSNESDAEDVVKTRPGLKTGLLHLPYTPFPGKSDRATREKAREIMKSLAKPYLDGESGYRITSTVSSIAGEGLAYNPISDIMANNADASSCFLASKLASLTHNTAPATSSSESYPRQSARSSSAHSHITPCHGERSSPTLSDIVRFRNRIGILSEFLRNPRHRPPKPVVRSDSDASTQHSDDTKSSKK